VLVQVPVAYRPSTAYCYRPVLLPCEICTEPAAGFHWHHRRAPAGRGREKLAGTGAAEHQTKPCVSASGAHDGESNQFIAASGATAPHRPVPDYHTGKKSLPSSPYHTISITPRGCKKLGEMRSKGLLPPSLLSFRLRLPVGPPTQSCRSKRAIIYRGAPSKRGASMITLPRPPTNHTGQPHAIY